MIRLPEIKTAELSTYGNFAKCHQALFRVPREGLGTRLSTRHPPTVSLSDVPKVGVNFEYTYCTYHEVIDLVSIFMAGL